MTWIFSVNLVRIQILIHLIILALMLKYTGLICVTVVVILMTVRSSGNVGGDNGGNDNGSGYN
jgi:hypothetical protein